MSKEDKEIEEVSSLSSRIKTIITLSLVILAPGSYVMSMGADVTTNQMLIAKNAYDIGRNEEKMLKMNSMLAENHTSIELIKREVLYISDNIKKINDKLEENK